MKNVKISSRSQRGSLYVEVLIALVILAIFGAMVMSYITQHQRLQAIARVRDTANYTANAAARIYKANNCPPGSVTSANGTVLVSENGVSLFVDPAKPGTGSVGQSFRFRATTSYTPTGGLALNFELLDQSGKTLTIKTIPV